MERTAGRNVLYRIYDAEGRLLYVGATTNPGGRIREHALLQPWWDEAANIALERFDTLDDLIAAEKAAIQIGEPKYNIVHLQEYSWTHKPRRRRGGGSVYRRSSDGLWVGAVELPSRNGKRRRHRVAAKTREEAELKLAQLKSELTE